MSKLGLLGKIGIGTSLLSVLANASFADELFNQLYSGAFNLSAKHKILDEKENPNRDGKVYLRINDSDAKMARSLVLHPELYNFNFAEEKKTDILYNITDSEEPDGVFIEFDVKKERSTAVLTRYGDKIERVFSFENSDAFNNLIKKYNADVFPDGSADFSIFDAWNNKEFNGFYEISDGEGRRGPYLCGKSSRKIFPSKELAQKFYNLLDKDLLKRKEYKDVKVREIINH